MKIFTLVLILFALVDCSISESRHLKRAIVAADNNGDSVHYTVTDVPFTEDHSHTYFKDGFRDPDGLIWGTAMHVNLKAAGSPEKACAALDARPPSCDELRSLAKSLGYASKEGFSVYTREAAGTPVLPDLYPDRFREGSQPDPQLILSSAPYCELNYAQEAQNAGNVAAVTGNLNSLTVEPNIICVVDAKDATAGL